ncbi:MAG: PqqD family peptide modification chaperone [Candidatus Omnitrophota bacterium]
MDLNLVLEESRTMKYGEQKDDVFFIDTPFKRERDGGLIVMNRYGGEVFEINDVGKVILDCISRGFSFRGILKEMKETFVGVSDEQLFDDLNEYLDHLKEYCIISRLDDVSGR